MKRFMRVLIRICWFLSLIASGKCQATPSIVFNERDAVVWMEHQTLNGRLHGFFARQLDVHCNRRSFRVAVQNDSTFSFTITLRKGENHINARALQIFSDTVTLTLGFEPEPLFRPYAVFKNHQLTLHTEQLGNPWNEKVHYMWSADSRNPSLCRIKNKNDSVAVVQLPSANGIYYFNLVLHTLHDTVHFQTFVFKNSSGVHVFDITKDHAPWIDTAVIYEVTPSNFVQNGTYDAISNKLVELKQLGINTIWLQPIYRTFEKGQGYDVTDYFSLREDLGNEAQLRHLIQRAKMLHLRVLFDFVPNHTSIHHPYAQNCITYGTASHYYTFYQHQADSAQYSSFYKKSKDGFINYFWDDLVNLNYNNEEVQRWIMEACKYWIKKFDIDGYRFDAVWAVNARTPSFFKKLRVALKAIKPDLLLLAEDKGATSSVYDLGFDAAYDWTADTAWISHWSWQYKYDPQKNFTVFNHPDVSQRVLLLKEALFQNGAVSNLRLRFIENNDLPRFVNSHTIAATKMAAGLLFSLPGIPLLYNGQEVGCKNHPYSERGIFDPGKSIRSLDTNLLFPYYQKLIHLRQQYPALQSGALEDVPIEPTNKVVAFRRWEKDETFFVLLNMDSVKVTVHFNIPKTPGSSDYTMEDVLTGMQFPGKKGAVIELPLEAYGIRWLHLR